MTQEKGGGGNGTAVPFCQGWIVGRGKKKNEGEKKRYDPPVSFRGRPKKREKKKKNRNYCNVALQNNGKEGEKRAASIFGADARCAKEGKEKKKKGGDSGWPIMVARLPAANPTGRKRKGWHPPPTILRGFCFFGVDCKGKKKAVFCGGADRKKVRGERKGGRHDCL